MSYKGCFYQNIHVNSTIYIYIYLPKEDFFAIQMDLPGFVSSKCPFSRIWMDLPGFVSLWIILVSFFKPGKSIQMHICNGVNVRVCVMCCGVGGGGGEVEGSKL